LLAAFNREDGDDFEGDDFYSIWLRNYIARQEAAQSEIQTGLPRTQPAMFESLRPCQRDYHVPPLTDPTGMSARAERRLRDGSRMTAVQGFRALVQPQVQKRTDRDRPKPRKTGFGEVAPPLSV
jgi:hypothetical protein